MFQVFRNAWVDTQLRKKILYTLFIIILFRLGSNIIVPFVDSEAMKTMVGSVSLLNYLDVMTGGSLGKGTLLAMSITPYINASIIIQLLTVAIPPLEKLSKEGDVGRKKINMITKFTSLGIALFQAIAFYFTLANTRDEAGNTVLKYCEANGSDTFDILISAITIVACFVAGASLIIWLGDRINEKGLGNGISMILFAGIISNLPGVVDYFVSTIAANPADIIWVIVTIIIFLALVWFVIFMTNAERRIPVQYAKRVVGRKMYGGQSTHIPIKVAMAGVMPIIFAMSLMSLPQTICYFFGVTGKGDPITGEMSFWDHFVNFFSPQSGALYAIIYFLLIIAFNYFYVSIQYNPVEIANNLKKNNGAIPGYRPGKPTSDFIHNSLNKITLVGAIFLGIIAVFPIVLSMCVPALSGVSLGGTSLLIVVSVCLETVRSLESQMMMRHHKGFLE